MLILTEIFSDINHEKNILEKFLFVWKCFSISRFFFQKKNFKKIKFGFLNN